MAKREIPVPDKGKAADSIWEVSQSSIRPCTCWLRLVEASTHPSFTCLFAGIQISALLPHAAGGV